MIDFLTTLREQPVWRSPPEGIRAKRSTSLPILPAPLDQVHQTFLDEILPFGGGNVHPGFMGWAQGGGAPVGMLAEMLAAGLNANLSGRDHIPIAVELEVLGWVRQMFGFPDDATGLFLTGASQANFLAILIARTRALGSDVRTIGLGIAGERLRAYTSVAAHGCLDKAMEMAGLGSQSLRRLPVDSAQRVDLRALRQAIAADLQAGLTPFLVIGTAGTVDAGAVDDLIELADIADHHGLPFHVDGAHGALAVLSPELAPRVAGIERCFSLAFDFHKWGQVPYDTGFLLVRDAEAHRATFASPAVYLQRFDRGLASGDWWPCDYGPDLSRGFRALKTWFILKTYGSAALGAVMAQGCALAEALVVRINAEPDLELLAPTALNIVCFGFRAPGADKLNAQIVIDLQEAGRVVPSTTRVNGRTAIRAALFNHRTTMSDIEALVEGVLFHGRRRLQPQA
ncbi:MAG: pyridoxal phosphate-dependent decarboxylase family protein [Caulobacteraceae bacterium]